MTAESYAPLGDSYLPPTDSANSHIALELEKETSTPQFYQLKKKNQFVLLIKKKKSQLCISKLQKFGIISDYILTSYEVSTSNYFTNLQKTITQKHTTRIFSRMTMFFTYINICSFQQQKFQDFKLPTICCIMKRLPSTF